MLAGEGVMDEISFYYFWCWSLDAI